MKLDLVKNLAFYCYLYLTNHVSMKSAHLGNVSNKQQVTENVKTSCHFDAMPLFVPRFFSACGKRAERSPSLQSCSGGKAQH